MAGIIEPNAGPAVLGGPCIKCDGLGAAHVRMEAAQPEQPGRAPRTGAHRDPARGAILADFDEGRFLTG